MTEPQTLSRPLAARVADLPDPVHTGQVDAVQTSSAVADAAIDALNRGETHYTNRPGIVPLRDQLAAHLTATHKIAIGADEITITCGAVEARFAAVNVLAGAGKGIVCPGDATLVATAAQLVGVPVVQAVADCDAVGIVWLSPADDRVVTETLLLEAAAQKWWIVWDVSGGAESDFHPAQDEALAPLTVTIGDFGDAMQGWGVGFMAGSEMAGQLKSFKQSITICTTNVSQWAALGLMEAAK
ncbi:hypothetical protein ACFLYO_05115 [Chloroflexota bacterium]